MRFSLACASWVPWYSLFIAIVAINVAIPSFAQDSPALHSFRNETDAAYLSELGAIATKFRKSGHSRLAERSERWFVARTPGRQIVFAGSPRDALADEIQQAGNIADADVTARWLEDMSKARRNQADRLWQLVDTSITEGRADVAVGLLYEILREQPADKRALRALGLNRKSKSSVKPRIARNAQPALGWAGGDYWRIQTDHFLITTNHSAEAAQQLSLILEELHDVWEQVFVYFWSNADSIRQAVRGRGIRRRSAGKHKVVLFRNQQEYVQHLIRLEPQAKMTLGLYRANDRTSFFFAGENEIDSENALCPTWRHEVAHQLFFESTRRGGAIAEDHNFWLIEGLALYFESMYTGDGYYSIGGFESERLQFARYRALQEGFYVPLEELSEMGRVAIQQDSRIRRLYSQAAGLVHFLMDGSERRLRDKLIEFAKQLYNGKADVDSLSSICGKPFVELDDAYLDYLFVDDEELEQLPSWKQVRKLCLGHRSPASRLPGSTITDVGLRALSEQRNLDWLDLANCKVTDEGVLRLQMGSSLKQLNLEGTSITDAAIPHISKSRNLEELDLSGTSVSDQSMEQLAKLTDLRVLWLTGTRVSNAGLKQLSSLQQLKMLDVGRTNVTAEAWNNFKSEHPDLNRSVESVP